MHEQNKDLLTDLETESLSIPLYFSQKKVILISLIAVISLSVITTLKAVHRVANLYTLYHQPFSQTTIVKTWCLVNYFGLPVIALAVAALVSLFNFHGMSYRKKYFPFFIVMLAILYLVEFLYMTLL